MCRSKALVDLGLGSNPYYLFTEQGYDMLMDLVRMLHLMKLVVEALCRRDTNLITAKSIFRSVICKLQNLNKPPLVEKLVTSLRKQSRETNSTLALLYLYDPFKCEEDRTEFMHGEAFKLPSKKIIRKEIKTVIQKLKFR